MENIYEWNDFEGCEWEKLVIIIFIERKYMKEKCFWLLKKKEIPFSIDKCSWFIGIFHVPFSLSFCLFWSNLIHWKLIFQFISNTEKRRKKFSFNFKWIVSVWELIFKFLLLSFCLLTINSYLLFTLFLLFSCNSKNFSTNNKVGNV